MNEIRRLTLDTSAASYALTDLATVKRALDIDAGNTDDDTYLTESIDRASAAIAAYCDRVFAAETVTERIWLTKCRQTINLRRYPNVSITAITEDDVALTEDEDFLIDDEKGQLHRLSDGDPDLWAACVWIVITYQAGFDLPDDIDDAIEDACIRLVRMAYSAQGRDALLKADEVEGIGRQEFWIGSTAGSGAELPDEVRILLDPFRNLVIG